MKVQARNKRTDPIKCRCHGFLQALGICASLECCYGIISCRSCTLEPTIVWLAPAKLLTKLIFHNCSTLVQSEDKDKLHQKQH
jgi:hypothetical protein